MDWLSRFFNKTNNEPKGPPVQEVEVHFSYGSTNLQYLYALDDVLVYMYYGHKREHSAQIAAFRDRLS